MELPNGWVRYEGDGWHVLATGGPVLDLLPGATPPHELPEPLRRDICWIKTDGVWFLAPAGVSIRFPVLGEPPVAAPPPAAPKPHAPKAKPTGPRHQGAS